jgi:transposase
LTTKLHVSCIDEHSAIAMTLTEGQRHDSVPVPDLLAQSSEHGEITRVTADRAYDGDPIRKPLQNQGVETVIPAHPNRKNPPLHDIEHYKLRHKVENFFRKLFDFRRVATRYEKLAKVFLAVIQIISSVVLLRSIR